MIYLDYAATTPLAPQAAEYMKSYFSQDYGNASAVYELGQKSREALESARKVIARSLHVFPGQIYFTGGGSESDNWALKGIARAYQDKGRHIITTSIEHPAVLNSCRFLEQEGYEVTYLPVDEKGFVELDRLEAAIREDTILISVMFANNEIGTVEPIAKIGRMAKKYGILFHTDAVQAYGHLPIDAHFCGIDLLSASGHKFYGPKGTGFLYIKEGINIESLIHGGGQEQGRRAGTENVPGIAGMGMAAKLAIQSMSARFYREARLRDYMIREIFRSIPDVHLNGDLYHRLPGNINVSFEGIEGETLLLLLNAQDICASAASACSAGSGRPSHVLAAIGRSPDLSKGSLRMTLGGATTKEEIDRTLQVLEESVKLLRENRE